MTLSEQDQKMQPDGDDMATVETKLDIILVALRGLQQKVEKLDNRLRNLEEYKSCLNGAKAERDRCMKEMTIAMQKQGLRSSWSAPLIIGTAAIFGGVVSSLVTVLLTHIVVR